MSSLSRARYRRYRHAIDGLRLPLAVVDLEALEANADLIVSAVRRQRKALRIATKSL